MTAQLEFTKKSKHSTESDGRNADHSYWYLTIWFLAVLVLLVSLLISKRVSLLRLQSLLNGQTYQTANVKNDQLNSLQSNADLTASMNLQLATGCGALATNLATGTNYTANVYLNSGEKLVVGADAYIKFDPKQVTIVSVQEGDFFSTYPTTTFQQDEGLVILSGIVPMEEEPVSGQGLLGSFTFQLAEPGTASLSLDFTPHSTRDCNVIEDSAKDILGSIQNLDLTATD
jgi:hypothetical protein